MSGGFYEAKAGGFQYMRMMSQHHGHLPFCLGPHDVICVPDTRKSRLNLAPNRTHAKPELNSAADRMAKLSCG